MTLLHLFLLKIFLFQVLLIFYQACTLFVLLKVPSWPALDLFVEVLGGLNRKLSHPGSSCWRVTARVSHCNIVLATGILPWWLLALHWVQDRPTSWLTYMTDQYRILWTQNTRPDEKIKKIFVNCWSVSRRARFTFKKVN